MVELLKVDINVTQKARRSQLFAETSVKPTLVATKVRLL